MKEINGIIISIQDYREYDTLMQVLSEEGRFSIVGRGHRRTNSKLAPICQLFAYVSFQCRSKNEYASIFTLRNASLIHMYPQIRNDLLKQAIALMFIESTLVLKDIDLFSLLKISLQQLEKTNKPYACGALFLAQLIHLEGIDPYVDGCVCCRVKQVSALSITNGGFVCGNCKRIEDYQLNAKKLHKFRLIQKALFDHYEIIEKNEDWDFEDLLLQASFLNHHGFIELHSIELLKKISALSNIKDS